MKKLLKNYAVFAALVLALVVGMASCKNNSDSDEDETFDAGPCTDVTSLDDLLGTWHYVEKDSDEGEKDGKNGLRNGKTL